jgi:galactose mutarotase-like enzyme
MKVTIKNGGYEATINSVGAELTSYKTEEGKEYLWNADPAFWPRSSPLLFPSIGNVRNDKTIIGGVEYPMPKHGFCREQDFAVEKLAENQAAFSLKDNEITHGNYPFSFTLRLIYTLRGSQLDISYEVSNQDTKTMPYHLGAHPGFNCPLEKGETLEDYVIRFDREEKMESHVYDLENMCFDPEKTWLHEGSKTELALKPEMFDRDALFFYHPASKGISLVNPATEKGIHLDYPDFASIAVWTPMGGAAPLICLEPWNGSAIFADEDDHFEHKRDIQLLAAGETKTYRLTISIL